VEDSLCYKTQGDGCVRTRFLTWRRFQHERADNIASSWRGSGCGGCRGVFERVGENFFGVGSSLVQDINLGIDGEGGGQKKFVYRWNGCIFAGHCC
jgi:hypothetical protein